MTTLTHFGAAGEVTGSCHMLESATYGRVLLDCGMHQGGDDVDRYKKEKFAFKPGDISAVILSHAHLDHSGLLPKLVHDGFGGPIFCTPATRDLLTVLLEDSFGLYTSDLERENRRRERSGRKPLEPAYTADDVEGALNACACSEFGEVFTVGEGLTAKFLDAGHILGSSIVELTMRETQGARTLVYSGDIGGTDTVLMNQPEVPPVADIVLMESTYGDRNHRDMDQTITELRDVLRETWKRKGNVLIPSFAVGRTQEILFHLGLLHQAGELNNWQVFLDSPMAIEVTALYDRWMELWSDEDVKRMRAGVRQPLEQFLPGLNLCQSTEDSMAINKVETGAIIIAGSGMCTGGRIRHHIKHRIWRDNTTMVFIGYQATGTLGRLLVDGIRRIKLFRETYAVKARIETLGGFSAHAGQDELISWVRGIGGNPEVVLVHGEPEASAVLKGRLSDEFGMAVSIAEREAPRGL